MKKNESLMNERDFVVQQLIHSFKHTNLLLWWLSFRNNIYFVGIDFINATLKNLK